MNEETVSGSAVADFADSPYCASNLPAFVKDDTTGAMFFVRRIETAPNGALVVVIAPEKMAREETES